MRVTVWIMAAALFAASACGDSKKKGDEVDKKPRGAGEEAKAPVVAADEQPAPNAAPVDPGLEQSARSWVEARAGQNLELMTSLHPSDEQLGKLLSCPSGEPAQVVGSMRDPAMMKTLLPSSPESFAFVGVEVKERKSYPTGTGWDAGCSLAMDLEKAETVVTYSYSPDSNSTCEVDFLRIDGSWLIQEIDC